MNSKHLAPALAVVATLGIVGGFAASQAFKPVTHEPAKIVNVQNAGQTVTPSPTATTTTKPVVKVAPKPVAKPAPVKSVRKQAPAKVAPQTVQRQAIVSEQPAEPQPTDPPAAPTPLGPPPAIGGSGTYDCGPSGCVTQHP